MVEPTLTPLNPEHNDPLRHEPGSAPNQPETNKPLKASMPVVIGVGGVILVIGLANGTSLFKNKTPNATKSALTSQPSSPTSQQVTSFETQQRLLARKDQEADQQRQVLAAQMAQLQQEQEIPGPESANATPMTAAQKKAIYGDSPNGPQKTSPVTQAQAEAKQRQLAREKQHQDALNSDTVAVDFTNAGTSGTSPVSFHVGTAVNSDTQTASTSGEPEDHADDPATAEHPAATKAAGVSKDPLAAYEFDQYQGRMYRVFEGTVFEGVVTNHIDGSLAGPIIVMLTTDYYSHDHQQLLLPQGTRLIGNVGNVSSVQTRKLLVVFNRAICPDGFSVDLNKFTGLDPLGTSGLATGVNNHYLSSFAAAAAVGGIGGLAQIGTNGSTLDSNTQIRNGISQQTAQESEQILNRFLSRLPTITVKEGSRARVYINRDILIPSYAEHRVDPAL